MGKRTFRNIILVGFSYTGKTRVGREVARRLGWKYVDTDDEIVRLASKPIPEIFTQDGEPKFRDMEREILRRFCRENSRVISTGGGIVADAANRDLMSESGLVICLEAKPETIHKRLLRDAEENPGQEVRPLLTVPDPLARITELKASRQSFYALSDWTVHTDLLSIDRVAEEVVRIWKDFDSMRTDVPSAKKAVFTVTTKTENYPILVDWGWLDQLGRCMNEAGLMGRVHIISDDRVYPHYGEEVRQCLKEAGFDVDSYTIPSGEQSKSPEMASRIYDWLIENRVERGDSIVALGGGVVGDLAGFIAATILRGISFVQVPTSLMAMVDSSIGGKVGMDHQRGKNLIGAFYQPRLVFMDIKTLSTLPKRELNSGWAEVIKHALIRDAQLLDLLDNMTKELIELERIITTDAIARSVVIKGTVVSEDEKEKGLRTILNYGHTIAHGLEAATGYERFLHGEAVAIGMMGAAMISRRLGLLSEDDVKRQQRILQKFGLPVDCAKADVNAVYKAIQLDKKVKGKRVRWVLLDGIGSTVIRDDVSDDIVENVIKELAKH